MDSEWRYLISKFEKLGGIGSNVYQKIGKNGRGLFPINTKIKSKIFVPEKLLIKENDVILDNDKIRIKETKNYNKEIRDFFNFYQDNFAWGRGGKEITENFEKEISSFPPELKKLIQQNIFVNIEKRQTGNWNEILLKNFLTSRVFKFKNNNVIVPMLELCNHKVNSSPFLMTEEGFSSPNYKASDNEITYNYNDISTLNRFFTYGFFCEESIVFSFPFNLKSETIGLSITCKGKELKNDDIKIERKNSSICIIGLPIGDKNFPNLPKDYFFELINRVMFNKINQKVSNNLLDKIIDFNILNRKKMLNILNKLDNSTSSSLRKAITHEVKICSKDD